MKIILMLAASLSLLACSKSLPEYPSELKKIHMILIPDTPITPETASFIKNIDDMEFEARAIKVVTCMEFDVLQTNPYQFDFKGVVDLKECHEVGGYKADENVKLWNWIDDVFRKAEENKCFKK